MVNILQAQTIKLFFDTWCSLLERELQLEHKTLQKRINEDRHEFTKRFKGALERLGIRTRFRYVYRIESTYRDIYRDSNYVYFKNYNALTFAYYLTQFI